MRLKYTTYDVRRGEDVIHLDADTCNIMVQNPKYTSDQTVPPYLYGHVLGIFHADANYSGELGQVPALPVRVEFLWVRWYESVNNAEPKGPLECITFPDITSPDSTTFIDPMSVLRAAHVIPRFSRGRKYSDGNGLSKLAKDGNEWSQYYVNRCACVCFLFHIQSDPFLCRFVDRDMYMRYKIGMAVGHAPIWPLEVYSKTLKSSPPQPIGANLASSPHPGREHDDESEGGGSDSDGDVGMVVDDDNSDDETATETEDGTEDEMEVETDNDDGEGSHGG